MHTGNRATASAMQGVVGYEKNAAEFDDQPRFNVIARALRAPPKHYISWETVQQQYFTPGYNENDRGM